MLAIYKGTPIVDSKNNNWPIWPVWGLEEKQLMEEVVESGVWSYNGPMESRFIKLWNEFTKAEHSLLVANGTVSIQLALESLDIGYGDEVIVPGITWQATAAAVVDINAVPVLVDVEADTWCIDPAAIEAAITPRTRAIIPVHLYGNMANMDAVMKLAEKHDLKVIEDAAHKHGGEWNGRKAGTIGHIGSFSLQLSKVLTAGEGGILTTMDKNLWMKLDALRNCGRRPDNVIVDKSSGQYGVEGDLIQSGNYRITEFQAAILVAQFSRLSTQNALRETNAKYLDSLLTEIPGILKMKDDPRETKKTYFNYAFRFDEKEWGIPVSLFRDALSAEIGFQVEGCYQPLNDCSLYRPQTKKRYQLNDDFWTAIDPSRFDLPVCEQVYKSESVTFAHRFLMGSKADMEIIVRGIKKLLDNIGELKSLGAQNG